jgi:hypothetical protein
MRNHNGFIVTGSGSPGQYTKESKEDTMQSMTPAKTFFTSASHQERFIAAVQRQGKTWPEEGGKFDPAYGAAFYVLTADSGIWEAAKTHIDEEGIDFEAMLNQPLSSGELVLLKWAANLFNELVANINPIELMRLDETNFALALAALQIRRYGFRPN